MKTRTKASRPTTAAAIARPLSTTLRVGAAGIGRGAGAGRGAAGAAATAGRDATAGPAVAGVGALVPVVPATGAAGAGVAAATAAGDGILIVGAAVGFGGKLIRTVSFFGCTLADSEGLGGGAPPGALGVFSAINVYLFSLNLGFTLRRVKCLLRPQEPRSITTGPGGSADGY